MPNVSWRASRPTTRTATSRNPKRHRTTRTWTGRVAWPTARTRTTTSRRNQGRSANATIRTSASWSGTTRPCKTGVVGGNCAKGFGSAIGSTSREARTATLRMLTAVCERASGRGVAVGQPAQDIIVIVHILLEIYIQKKTD